MAHKKGHLANVAATQIYSCQQDSESGWTAILVGEQTALWVVEVVWWKSFLERVQCVFLPPGCSICLLRMQSSFEAVFKTIWFGHWVRDSTMYLSLSIFVHWLNLHFFWDKSSVLWVAWLIKRAHVQQKILGISTGQPQKWWTVPIKYGAPSKRWKQNQTAVDFLNWNIYH